MPKCQPDEDLQRRVRLFVQAYGGNASAAALHLSVNRIKLWRFLQTGNALASTRAEISMRLDAVEASIREHGNETERKREVHLPGSNVMTSEEALMIKTFCQKVIAAVDFFEATASGSKSSSRQTAATNP